LLVLIDNFRRNVARDDATKDAATEAMLKLQNNANPNALTAINSLKTILNSDPKLFSNALNLKSYIQSQYLDLRNIDKTIASQFKPVLNTVDAEVNSVAQAAGVETCAERLRA